MTGSVVREWYLREIATIPVLDAEWKKQQVPLEERARRAWEIRHNARRKARILMEDALGVAILRVRDFVIYGHCDGPTFEQLVSAARKGGLNADESFRKVIEDAQTTSDLVDRTF